MASKNNNWKMMFNKTAFERAEIRRNQKFSEDSEEVIAMKKLVSDNETASVLDKKPDTESPEIVSHETKDS